MILKFSDELPANRAYKPPQTPNKPITNGAYSLLRTESERSYKPITNEATNLSRTSLRTPYEQRAKCLVMPSIALPTYQIVRQTYSNVWKMLQILTTNSHSVTYLKPHSPSGSFLLDHSLRLINVNMLLVN